MKNALLIVNPASGGEKAKEFEKQAQAKLETYFDEVQIKYTEALGDATAFAKEAAQNQVHSVFVMGGDGTVNEGISGIAEETFRPNFGFFPLGTVNDLARALGIPVDPKEAIEAISFDNLKGLDIGKINSKYFTNIVAIGTIPESINNVDDKQKTTLGPMAYLVNGLKNVVNNKTYPFTLYFDNKQLDIESSMILVGLTDSIGSISTILPEAKVDDGYLHLVYLKDKSFMDTLTALPHLLSKNQVNSDNVIYEKVKEIKIAVKSADIQTNVDGDQGDKLPVSLKVLPSHIKVYH